MLAMGLALLDFGLFIKQKYHNDQISDLHLIIQGYFESINNLATEKS